MTKRAGFSLAVLATAILLLAQNAPRAFAQDQDYPPDQPQYQQGDQDPPTRAGRISAVEGSVSFQAGGEGDWLDAVRNRPLTVGDNLWVDKDSRAEIQIGSTSIRLGPGTSVTFLDLGNNVTQLRLSLGSIYFRVRRFDGDDAFEVDTPNLAFNVNRAGTFRVDTNENGDQTLATVYRGEAEITGSGNSYRLAEGQEGTFSGTDQLSYDVADIQSPDDFGRWAQSRDERQDSARSREYVSQDMTGYEDLDDYGSWRNDPEYGNVWQPRGVPGDWAPYRYGHWAYVSPWGWTWVEDEPWGFAPFHYGRWAYARNSWCWVPGPVAVAPVYAPALVAFVGGAGFSVGIGIGSQPVGWFPLGPREVYVPWYHTSPRYVQNVNVTNTRVSVVQVTNVYNNYTVNKVTNVTYVNQRVNNSVTVVNHDTFVNARPVNRNIQRVDARQLANARVTPGVVRNVQPSRQSYMGAAHAVQYRPPQQAMSRQVVATRQPVAYNRPANRPNGGPAGATRPAPPPVKTVRAAPAAQVQPLQRGARGGPNPTGPGARPGQPNRQANRPGQPNAPGNRPGQPNGSENRPGQPNGPDNRGAAPRPGQPNAPENRPGQPNAPDNRGAAPRPGQPNAPENRPGQPNAPDNRGAAPRPGQPNAPENRPGQPNAPDNRGAAPRPGQPNAPDNRPGQPNGPDNRGAAPRPGQPNNNGPDNRPGQPNAPDNRGAAPRPGQPNNAPDNRPGQPNNNRNVPRPGAPNNSGPSNNAPGGRPNDNAPRPGAPDNRPAPPETRNAPGDNGRPGQVPRPPSGNRSDQMPEQQPRQYPGTRPENNRPQEQPQARPENNRPQPRPENNRPPETPQTRPEQPARPPDTRPPSRPDNRPQAAPPENRQQRNNPPPEARPAQPPPQRESRPVPPPPQRETRPAPPPPQRESRPAPPQRNDNPPKNEKPPKDKDKQPPNGR